MYDEMINAQGGTCYICGSVDELKALAVDHDHDSGVVRKLLCSRCNTGLGCFKDNTEILKKAISYLEEHKNDN